MVFGWFKAGVIACTLCLFWMPLVQAQAPDGDFPTSGLVIVKNTDLRHQYCLGVAITAMTVVTALECAQAGFSELEVYENMEALNNGDAKTYKVHQVRPDLTGGKVAHLDLRTPLETTVPSGFMFPELSIHYPATFYFLAKHQSRLIIHQRKAELQKNSGAGHRFTVMVRGGDHPVVGYFIYGAVLFNADHDVIGVAFDEMYLYSLMEGAAYFYSITRDAGINAGRHNDEI